MLCCLILCRRQKLGQVCYGVTRQKAPPDTKWRRSCAMKTTAVISKVDEVIYE